MESFKWVILVWLLNFDLSACDDLNLEHPDCSKGKELNISYTELYIQHLSHVLSMWDLFKGV